MGEYDGHRERLRNHYRDHGMDALRDYEVLELLLFYAVPRKDTQPVARKLLAHFGSIAAVLDAAPQELKDVSGLSDNAILLLQMMPALSRRYLVSRSEVGVVLDSTKATGQFIVPYFHGEMDEVIYLLCLDSKQKLTACTPTRHLSFWPTTIPAVWPYPPMRTMPPPISSLKRWRRLGLRCWIM